MNGKSNFYFRFLGVFGCVCLSACVLCLFVIVITRETNEHIFVNAYVGGPDQREKWLMFGQEWIITKK